MPREARAIAIKSGKHLACLDGLRGMAILMVVMIHSSQLITGLALPLRNFAFYGVRGVQLFFVVSGLTLVMAYRAKPFHWPDFAVRRFFRIAPMFYLAALFYLILGSWDGFRSGVRDASALDVSATLLFVHGWFPGAINKVVPGGWSIAAEAMFYAIFPVLLFAARDPRKLALILAASYGVAGITNLLLTRLGPGSAEFRAFAFEFWLCHLPAFAGGCFLATIADRVFIDRRAARWLLWAALLCLIVDSQLRGVSNLLVAIMLLTIFAWLVVVTCPAVFGEGLLPFLGKISFSLYLLHFFVLDLVRPFAPPLEDVVGPSLAFLTVFGVTIGIAGLLATLSYKYIELPFIRLGRVIGRNVVRE